MSTRRTFAESLERALHRSKAGKILMIAQAGVGLSAMAAGPALQGCEQNNGSNPETTPPENTDDGVIIGTDGKGDWAQDEGKRNTTKVMYMAESWRQDNNCEPRAGCMSTDVFLKVKVQSVAGADLSKKRVGVVLHEPGRGGQTTANGEFFADLGNGLEEWHVKVSLKKWEHPGAFVFTAWYQDGAGSTWYDDNEGEYHVAAWLGTQAVLHNTHGAAPTLTDAGLSGSIMMELLDLDYDKDVRLIWTLDDWKTVNEYKIGPEHVNNWHWLKNTYNGMQLWEIILDYKGTYDTFRYAVVYKHGGKNGSQVYEFWDNNGGQDYQVAKGQAVTRF
jgi:hypothetical protein